jgi:hypothetical protein
VLEMIQARIVAVQVMDLWHISGAILTDESGAWEPLATFSDDIPLAATEAGSHDPASSLLRAIAVWSDMTMRR